MHVVHRDRSKQFSMQCHSNNARITKNNELCDRKRPCGRNTDVSGHIMINQLKSIRCISTIPTSIYKALHLCLVRYQNREYWYSIAKYFNKTILKLLSQRIVCIAQIKINWKSPWLFIEFHQFQYTLQGLFMHSDFYVWEIDLIHKMSW